MINAVFMHNLIVIRPEAFLAALIGAICISVFGAVLLIRELVMRGGQRRIQILGLGVVSLFWPLYIWIGYINVLLYIVPVVGPVWFAITILIVRRGNYLNSLPLLAGAALLNTLALSILLLQLLRVSQIFPRSNEPNIGLVIVVFLLFPILLGHGFIIRFLTKRWTKDRMTQL
ncbi:MAG TPA: hypothetical protein VKY19_21805 [Ktedonosporobacter sp.]|jgi:hypothetical protein|nr:hypothetical protein [Ktedonosporobacter sp.]